MTEKEKLNEAVKKRQGNKSLGTVDIPQTGITERSNLESMLNYIKLDLTSFPSGGRFYPTDMSIHIRAAKVMEIRDFSTIDETNIFDIDEKLNNMLIKCSRIKLGNNLGSYKDIIEEDRIFVILSIREYTFAQGESTLNLNATCTACEHDNTFDLKTANLQYHEEDKKLTKSYSAEHRCYVIHTKTLGDIKMSPPKIGIMKEVTGYIKEREQKKLKWDKSFFQVIPYITLDWKGFNKNAIGNALIDYQGWTKGKYSLIFKKAEIMKVGVKQELSYSCANCGEEVKVPIEFEGGLKSLFLSSEEEVD